jgi:signal transduction histidine kinase
MPPQEILVCAKPSAARRAAGVLRSRGYAVETASDGIRAVERAERDNPAVALIWSDLRGPETSAVVRRVREASGAKVAVIVKKDAADRASTFLEAGADAVVPDARDLDRLARTVDRLLGGGLVDTALDLDVEFDVEEVVPNGNGHNPEDVPAAEEPEGTDEAPLQAPQASAEPGIDFQPCDVAEIVHEGAAEAARGCPSVVVQVSAPPRLPAVAHAAALRGAVRALVEAACRGSEPGSDVSVKAQRVDAGIFVLVADRGPGPDREERSEPPADGEAPSGFILARALVALHGGILSAEPIPAGGRRVSFTIPAQAAQLSGVELQGGFRALELLEQAEAVRESEPAEAPDLDEEPEDEGRRLEQAIDLAAAAADAAALTPEAPPAEPDGMADPIRSLAELFGLEPPVEDDALTPDELEELAILQAGVERTEVEELDEVEVPEAEVDVEELVELEVPEDEVEEVEAPEAEVDVEEVEAPEAEVDVEGLVELEVPEAEELEVSEADTELEAAEAEPDEEEPAEPEPEPEPEPDEEEPPAAVITLPPPGEAPEPAAADVELAEELDPERVEIPEPVLAADTATAETAAPPPERPVMPRKAFVPDPLHPATAILRALAEEYDDQSNRFRGR